MFAIYSEMFKNPCTINFYYENDFIWLGSCNVIGVKLFHWQIMRIVSEKLEAENSWVLEKQQVDTICDTCNVSSSLNSFLVSQVIFLKGFVVKSLALKQKLSKILRYWNHLVELVGNPPWNK